MSRRTGASRQKRDTRPYVADAGRKPEGAVDAAAVTIGMVVLALIVGFIIGAAVWAVLTLSNLLISLVWNNIGGMHEGAFGSVWFPLAACALGGLVIGIWTRFTHNAPQSLEAVMAEFKQTGSYKVDGVGTSVVSFLLPLVFGGSVGPEAGLTGLITAGCCWIRDQLKRAGLRAGAVGEVTIAASLSAIFGAPLAGIVAGAESSPDEKANPDPDDYTFRKSAKLVLYLSAAVGAFCGIALISRLAAGSSGLPRFDAIAAEPYEYVWFIVCVLVGYALAFVFHLSRTVFSALSERMGKSDTATVLKPVLAGLVMGALAMAFPYVLFAGETQTHELMGSWGTFSALALIITGVLKVAITPMCLEMGWRGGNFFPTIFAGAAVGYGLAALTGADAMLMVTTTVTALVAGTTRKPLLTIGILVLCFPLDGMIVSGLAAVIGAALPMPKRLLSD